jgi:hypothetical protein
VRAILFDGAWHSTLEMIEAGILRPAARVLELRCAGYAIETRKRGTIGQYRLLPGAPRPDAPPAVCTECELGGGHHVEGCSRALIPPESGDAA